MIEPLDEARKQLQDYFESDAYKRKHVERALQDIADRLNTLEKLGYEPRDSFNGGCYLDAMPFVSPKGAMRAGIFYDFPSKEWRHSTSDPS